MPFEGVASMTPKGRVDVPLPYRAVSQIEGEHKSASFTDRREENV